MSNNLSHYIPLLELAKQLPSRPHLATMYRWSTRGIRGVKLRTYKVGRVRCTTREDAEQFFAAAASSDTGTIANDELRRTAAVDTAIRELAERGV